MNFKNNNILNLFILIIKNLFNTKDGLFFLTSNVFEKKLSIKIQIKIKRGNFSKIELDNFKIFWSDKI